MPFDSQRINRPLSSSRRLREDEEEEGGGRRLSHDNGYEKYRSKKRPRYDDTDYSFRKSSCHRSGYSSEDPDACLYVAGIHKDDTRDRLLHFLNDTIHKAYVGSNSDKVPHIVDCISMVSSCQRPFFKVILADPSQVEAAIKILNGTFFESSRLIVKQWGNGKKRSLTQPSRSSTHSQLRRCNSNSLSSKHTQDPSCMIFIANFPIEVTAGMVTEFIERNVSVKIVDCELIRRENKKSKYQNARVVLASPSQAQATLAKIDGMMYGDKPLHTALWEGNKIELANFRPDNPSHAIFISGTRKQRVEPYLKSFLKRILPDGMSVHEIDCYVFDKKSASDDTFTACAIFPSTEIVQLVLQSQHRLPFDVAPWKYQGSDSCDNVSRNVSDDSEIADSMHEDNQSIEGCSSSVSNERFFQVQDKECAVYINDIPIHRPARFQGIWRSQSDVKSAVLESLREQVASSIGASIDAVAIKDSYVVKIGFIYNAVVEFEDKDHSNAAIQSRFLDFHGCQCPILSWREKSNRYSNEDLPHETQMFDPQCGVRVDGIPAAPFKGLGEMRHALVDLLRSELSLQFKLVDIVRTRSNETATHAYLAFEDTTAVRTALTLTGVHFEGNQLTFTPVEIPAASLTPQNRDSCSVFVGNISRDVTDNDLSIFLHHLLNKLGSKSAKPRARIRHDRGDARVTFEDPYDVELLVNRTENSDRLFYNKILTFKPWSNKVERLLVSKMPPTDKSPDGDEDHDQIHPQLSQSCSRDQNATLLERRTVSRLEQPAECTSAQMSNEDESIRNEPLQQVRSSSYEADRPSEVENLSELRVALEENVAATTESNVPTTAHSPHKKRVIFASEESKEETKKLQQQELEAEKELNRHLKKKVAVLKKKSHDGSEEANSSSMTDLAEEKSKKRSDSSSARKDHASFFQEQKDKIKTLEDKIKTLEKLLQESQEQNRILQDLNNKQRSLVETQKLKHQMKMKALVEKQKETAKKEKEILKQQHKAQLKYCKDRFSEEKAALETKLEKANESMQLLRSSLDETTNKAISWKEEKKSLEEKLREARAQNKKSSTSFIALRASAANEKAELVIQQQEMNIMHQEITKEKEALMEERQRLKQQLEDAVNEKETLVLEKQELNRNLESRLEENKSLMEEGRNLRQRLEDAAKERIKVSSIDTGPNANGGDVSALQEKIKQLKQEITSVKIYAADQGRASFEEIKKLRARLEEEKLKRMAAEENLHFSNGAPGTRDEDNHRQVSSSHSDEIVQSCSLVQSDSNLVGEAMYN
ncbi:RNA recognition motif containing protein [Nitzschia inconspicua]|uniref:RNA recognition motif containing protein n=1 Tax=Nitzschia inconspicua TaxID=303405 RepID=A0A9K3KLC2_9STRA|nr:RNA recognition motif containing protein [Nitzschia inconspicua]